MSLTGVLTSVRFFFGFFILPNTLRAIQSGDG
jgi:hypothetical protein